jgi:hypothetical protein
MEAGDNENSPVTMQSPSLIARLHATAFQVSFQTIN